MQEGFRWKLQRNLLRQNKWDGRKIKENPKDSGDAIYWNGENYK